MSFGHDNKPLAAVGYGKSELKKAQDEKAKYAKLMRGLCDHADKYQSGVLTAQQQASFEAFEYKLGQINETLPALYEKLGAEKAMPTVKDVNQLTVRERNELGYSNFADAHESAETWIDANGKTVACLSYHDDYAKAMGTTERLSVGKYIRGMVTGKWSGADREKMLAQSEGQNTPGGYLVPEELSDQIIQLARAKMVCLKAGAKTFPMTSDTMTMARISSDPTIEIHPENSLFSGSQVVFDGVEFNTTTYGQIVYISRELLQDAPNAAATIEDCMAKAMGLKLDALMLAEIASHPKINETSSIGTLGWENLNTAVVTLLNRNGGPTSYICNPTQAGELSILTSGNGTNAAKLWLGPPPLVEPLTQFKTTACAAGSIYVGGLEEMAYGVRRDVELELSPYAGNAFASNQVAIRIVWRSGTAALRPALLQRLTGIS